MADGYLTTHVLDTARGVPAEGIHIILFFLTGTSNERVTEAMTNADGRTDEPILKPGELRAGQYELVFEAGEYLDTHDPAPKANRFLDVIPIRFGIDDPNLHYHVPLLLSPFGYATYRGS